MEYVPLFIKYRRLIMTDDVQKSNEWIQNCLFCTDNEVSQSLCNNNNDMSFLMMKEELYRAKPIPQLASGKGK